MRDFEVVVIGAGLGGLSAAASLAKEGKKVLLLEKHNVPGGYASSFVRGRFEFEISLHELSDLGNQEEKGPVWRLLNEYGVAPKVEFLYIPEFYRAVYPDLDIIIPVGRENFEAALCEQFPHCAEEIREFSAVVHNFAEEALRANRVGMKMVMQEPSEFPTLLAHYGKTLAQVLDPMVPDAKARAVLSQTWGYYCNPPSRLSFLIYALATVGYLRFGPAHIRGRSQALSQAFVDAIEENGGEVWLNNGAARILVSQGKVRGVLAEDGTEIHASYVVSNASPLVTCYRLLEREEVPSWYLKRLGIWTPGAATFNVYLGLDCTCEELGLNVHENFVNSSYDMERQYELMRSSLNFEPDGAAVTAYNVVDPEFSPPGTASVVLTLIAYSEPWLRLKPFEYLEAKERLADRMLALAERVAPDIREHIEEIEVASPLTNMRFSGNPGGSIIGFDENYTGTGMDHLPNRGPLEGLYFAGAWANIGGGYETCIFSGFFASRQLLEDMERGGWDQATREKLEKDVEKQTTGGPAWTSEDLDRAVSKVDQLHPKRVKLRVSEIIEETATTKTLRMVSADGELPLFRAGQYVNLFVEIDGVLTSRPYSIASPPHAPYWDITVRRAPQGFVSHYLLDRVKVGDVLESTGPFGSFYYEPLRDSDDLVFLAGGSGITPFASIIREAVESNMPVRIHLIYGSREPGDVIFLDELMNLEAKNENIQVDLVISEPTQEWGGLCGFIDAEMISNVVGSVEGKTFYICGPAPMYPLCEGALESLGVPKRRIRREAYGPPVDVNQDPEWPGISPDEIFTVTEERSGKSLKARAGEPLMIALERSGIVVPAVCRAGECTYCRTKLVEGKIYAPSRVRRRWVDEKAGYIHPCMSYPLSDLKIRI